MAEPIVVNIADGEWKDFEESAHCRGKFKPLTPALSGVRLGVNISRLPPNAVGCPFHTHAVEDECFYVISGRGVLRYGDALHELKAGDTVSCPAGTGIAHQIGNPYDEELVYLGIGPNDPHEVCTYPDSGKIMVRALHQRGRLQVTTAYMDGEPETPRLLEMTKTTKTSTPTSG